MRRKAIVDGSASGAVRQGRNTILLCGWMLLLGVIAAQTVALMDVACLNDDYLLLDCVDRHAYLRETINSVHYLPLTGFLFDLCTRLPGIDSAVALRVLHGLARVLLAVVIYLVISRVSHDTTRALFVSFFTVMHPLSFEVFLYNINMQWTLSLFVMMIAIWCSWRYAQVNRVRFLLGALILEMICLLSNIGALSVVPAVILVYLIESFKGERRPPKVMVRDALVFCLPPVIYAGILGLIYYSHPPSFDRVIPASPGMFLVNHLWIIYMAFSWHIAFGLESYIWLCSWKSFGLPLASWMAMSAALVLLLRLCLRSRNRFALEAFAIMLCTTLIPPKAYLQPRYCFLLLPWVGILVYAVLDALFKERSRNVRRVVGSVIVLVMAWYSVAWYQQQIAKVTTCSDFVKSMLAELPSDDLADRLVLRSVPQVIGVGEPWPRMTFFGPEQLEIAVTRAGRCYKEVAVEWFPYEKSADDLVLQSPRRSDRDNGWFVMEWVPKDSTNHSPLFLR